MDSACRHAIQDCRKVSSTVSSTTPATEVTWYPEVTRATHTALPHSLHVHIIRGQQYKKRGAQNLHAQPHSRRTAQGKTPLKDAMLTPQRLTTASRFDR
jgi:hypothetical protein